MCVYIFYKIECHENFHRNKICSDQNIYFQDFPGGWENPPANAGGNESESRSVVSDSLWPHELYSPWNSPGQNTGVGSLSFLQGIFPTQVFHTAGRFFTSWPKLLKEVAYPFSSGSSQARNQTRVSCIAGGFFTNWAIREALPMHRQ